MKTVSLAFVFLLLIALAVGVNAQECGDAVCDVGEDEFICPLDCFTEPPGFVEETGTSFTLNTTTLSSTEIVTVLLLAGDTHFIDFTISGSTASTTLTLNGLQPNTIYYVYQDDYHNLQQVTSDASGSLSFTQDLSQEHHVFIQDQAGTKFIKDDATGGDCSSIGSWNSGAKTCTLTTNLFETVQIDNNDITLDCAGHSITGSGSGNGVLLSSKSGVTIKNCDVQSFVYGIFLGDSNSNTLTNNQVNNNNLFGIFLPRSISNTLTSNTANNNLFGIYLFSHSNSNTLTSNTANNNLFGIVLSISNSNTLTNNQVSHNSRGIFLSRSISNTLTSNTVNDNINGIYLSRSHSNTLTSNTVNDNINGIFLFSSNSNTLTSNTVNNNGDFGIRIFFSSGNIIFNNFFNNTNNAFDDGFNNWNTTKTPGTNIIGGPFLGGNFWHDYTGLDIDTDGLGDTNIPYNSNGNIQNGGDFLPLVFIDTDSDGIPDDVDICPFDVDNDADGDGICGDVDICPFDPLNDIDGDGICGGVDNCPFNSNSAQTDSDGDGIGDACDVQTCGNGVVEFPASGDGFNFDEQCDDGNTVSGDGCSAICEIEDADGDGIDDATDNCPAVPNPDQADSDGDSGLLLWNKLGSATEVLNSEVGSAMSEVGSPVYIAGKFGNGFYATGSGRVETVINPVMFDNERGTVEIWFKHSATTSAAMFALGNFQTGNFRVQINYLDTTTLRGLVDLLSVQIILDGRIDISGLTSGEWNHAALSWDRDGIAGSSDTARFYLNGVLGDSTTVALPFFSFPANYKFRVANDIINGNAIGANSGVDNVKVYNYAKTDFSDRFNEETGLGDGIGDACDVQTCGNGVVEFPGSGDGFSFDEQCDDGNTVSGDGCSAICEIEDTDGDGVTDNIDNCPLDSNPDQSDIDGQDGGDVCDVCPSDATDTCDVNSTASESIGSEGGSVETPDGSVSMTLPEGALDNDTSISITENGTSFELSSNLGQAIGIFGLDIQPEGTVFNEPVTLVFSWDDADNDGFVDGTNVKEDNLLITQDNVAITDKCKFELVACDTVANTFTFNITSLSVFVLAAPLDSDGDGVPDNFDGVIDACPFEDATGLDANLDGCKDTIPALISVTQSLNLQQGIENSLDAKLQNVQDALDAANAGSTNSAINKLGAFINEVEAQRGNFITDEQADLLIAMVNNVITQI